MPEPFSPEQFARIQEYERQIALLLSTRKGAGDRKPWYESPGIVAIVTLVVTAVAGYASQTMLFQRGEKATRRAAQVAGMREALLEASATMSAVFKMNEERLLLAQGKMDVLPVSERDSISHNTNLIQQRWRADREKSDIALYLYAGPEIEATWDSVRQSLDRYTGCIEIVYQQFSQGTAPDTACAGMKSNAIDRLRTFKQTTRERFRAVGGFE